MGFISTCYLMYINVCIHIKCLYNNSHVIYQLCITHAICLLNNLYCALITAMCYVVYQWIMQLGNLHYHTCTDPNTHKALHTHMYTQCVYTRMYIHIHTRHTHTPHTHATHTHTHTHTYTCMHTHTHTRMHAHTRTHAHTHTHTRAIIYRIAGKF